MLVFGSSVSATGVIVSTVVMYLGEKTTMRMRMILDAPRVTTRFMNVVLPFYFFSWKTQT